ncbi:hypothetical protein BJ742DRAFT_2784 [Cladochytrium replicatum]|nr:hypothetical protein BJ742DRAFT_2784 [Cladochytrium replicatum]
MKAHVRRTKSGRQSVISDSILVGYRSKNMIAVELATRGNESNVIVLDSSSDDDSKACKGDNVSPNPGQNKVSKASRRRASAEDDVPPMTKGSTDLGSLLQSERKYSVSNVEKEFQRSSRSQLSLVPQNSPDEAGSSSDEETAPSQRAPSVFVSPPRELEQRDKHVEFLVTTRRRNRILHFKEGEFDSPATGMDENQHRDIAKASGTQQNPMVVWSSLPPVPKEKDQNPNPRLERKKAASRPSNLLQQLLGQREESLKARTPSRTTETGIGTSLKSSNAGDNNPFIDEKTRHKDRTTATNRSNDANRIPHSLDPGKGRDVKKDAKPFVVPSVVNKTQENAPGEQSLCIDSVLNSFSNLSISTTKKPIIELTVTLKTDISKPEGNSSTNSNNEGPSVTKATKNRTHTGDSLSSAISRGRECRSNERNVVEKQIKHQDSLTDDLIGSFTQLNVSKEGRIKTTFGPNSRQAEIVQKAAESAEIHPAPVKAKAQAPNVDGKVRRRLVIHSDDEDTEDGVEDRSRRAGPPQSTQKIAIPIPADQMSSKEHKTQSIEGKRRLHPIYLSSDDELSPVKRVDRPKLQPSSVQKRVDAAKQIHQPAGSFHPTVSTPHNMFSSCGSTCQKSQESP